MLTTAKAEYERIGSLSGSSDFDVAEAATDIGKDNVS
jgi:hypothetical protein